MNLLQNTHNIPEIKINIRPKIQSSLIPLHKGEYELLEKSLKKEGCRDPLIVYGNDNTLLDGHNRYKICQKHSIKYRIIHKKFSSQKAAIVWIKKNQLARRNLTDEAKRYLIGSLYECEKCPRGGDRKSEKVKSKGQNAPSINISTGAKLARQFKVSEKTVKRAAKYARQIDSLSQACSRFCGDKIKDRILTREIKIPRAYLEKLVRMPPDRQRQIMGRHLDGDGACIRSAFNRTTKIRSDIFYASAPLRVLREGFPVISTEEEIKLDSMDRKFQTALDNFVEAVQNEKRKNWRDTPKEVVLNYLKRIWNMLCFVDIDSDRADKRI